MINRSLALQWSKTNPPVKFVFIMALFGLLGVAFRFSGMWVASLSVYLVYLIVFILWLNARL